MDITEYPRSINDANRRMFKAKYGLREFHSDSRNVAEQWLKNQKIIKPDSLDTIVDFIDSQGELSKD